MSVPADILLFAIVAAVLVFWLRNTIGTRHGDERERPGFLAMEDVQNKESTKETGFSTGVDLSAFVSEENLHAVGAGLAAIARADRSFDIAVFIENAKDAFAIIVEAFASGDRDTLKNLLSEDVYKAFDKAILDRTDRGETVETEIHAVRKADLIEATLVDRIAYLTIRFTADETCVIKDSEQNIMSGDPDRITEMVDVWVFGRDVKSADLTWFLFETRDDQPEEHKTPMPEART